MITKEEASRLQPEEEAALFALEMRIDEMLRRGGPRTFDVRCISDRVRREIEQRYRMAGWTVAYNSDQFDGDYWTFS